MSGAEGRLKDNYVSHTSYPSLAPYHWRGGGGRPASAPRYSQSLRAPARGRTAAAAVSELAGGCR